MPQTNPLSNSGGAWSVTQAPKKTLTEIQAEELLQQKQASKNTTPQTSTSYVQALPARPKSLLEIQGEEMRLQQQLRAQEEERRKQVS